MSNENNSRAGQLSPSALMDLASLAEECQPIVDQRTEASVSLSHPVFVCGAGKFCEIKLP